jgi:hypothetical protein
VYRALIVCNSRFEDGGALPDLHGPKKDGLVLRDALTDHATGMFDKNDIQLLSEEGSLEVGRAIDDFFAAAEPDDTLLFYYSGHGRTRDQQLFLCARNTVAERLHSTAISESTISSIVSSSFAQVKIIILDCCYSGMLKGGEITDALAGTGRYIIAATSAAERAPDSSLRGMASPFTYALSDALITKANDRDGDGNVDLDDLYDYLKNAPLRAPRPQRRFDGAGAVPIARRTLPTKSGEKSSVILDKASLGGQDDITGRQDEAAPVLTYLDNTAPGAELNSERLGEFRLRMRGDVVEALPSELSSRDFLEQAGLLRKGCLTYAGILLFGKNPTAIMPTAMVQCVRFKGSTKIDPMESLDLQDTVPELIVRARDFVADHARLGDTPTAKSAYSEAAYRYPMIAVREIIANAVVHRDYEEQESCVQIHMFDDRIEVISPGGWGGTPTVAQGSIELGKLQRSSQKRNFRLARTLTWSKLVEGVGAGVPRAIADCRALGALVPSATVDEKMVIVRIFPGRKDVSGSGDVAVAPADRITVALISKAAEELQHLQDMTSLSKTDLVNRAITLYSFIEAQRRAGREMLIRNNETGEIQAVMLL